MTTVYLPSASQRRLMELSRYTLEKFVRGAKRQKHVVDDVYLQNRDYGAFVTLHKRDELRGCVGKCVPDAPLFETVSEMTEAAASRDARVEPIGTEELTQIHIDITVLSPLQSVKDPLDLELGRHGLYVASGTKRGVLLPQVAAQFRWDVRTFLEQTCLKAGLRPNAWQESDTRVSSFTALIIEEQL